MAKKAITSLSSLQDAVDKFNKEMGEGVIHLASTLPKCRKIQSSIPMYNYVSDGGFPLNRVIEHLGENGSLKSYTGYDAIAQFQHYDWANHEQGAFESFEYEGTGIIKELKGYKLRKGYTPKKTPIMRRVALVDLESTYTPDWGERFGIDNEGLILIRPTLLSESVDITQQLLIDENISFIMFDSLSAIGTDVELEKSMGDMQMASAASFWNKAIRKFQAALNGNPNKEASLLVINSSYKKVGIAYGDPEEVRNGGQLKRTKALSIKFSPLKEIQGKTEHGDTIVGRNITMKCLKNKVGHPGRTGSVFYAYSDYGATKACTTDSGAQIVELALRFGIAERKGAWYTYDTQKSQGIETFVEDLMETGLIENLEEEVYEAMGNEEVTSEE